MTDMSPLEKNEAAFAAFMQAHGESLTDWYTDVVALYGYPPYTRPVAVAHEAGHAVVALTLGGEMKSLSVFSAKPGIWIGWNAVHWPGVASRPVNALTNPTEAMHSLLYRIAGFVGEEAAGFSHMASSTDEVFSTLSVLTGVATRKKLDTNTLMNRLVADARHRIDSNADLFNGLRSAMTIMNELPAKTVRKLTDQHGVVKPPLKALW